MTGEHRTTDLSSLARGGSWNLLGSAGGALLSMALVVVVARGMGAAEGGALFEVIALYNIAVVMATLGADTGLVRLTASARGGESGRTLGQALLVALVPVGLVGTGLGIAGYLAAGTIGHHLGGEAHAGAVTDMVEGLAPFVPIGAMGLALLGATRGYGTMLPTVFAERLGRPALQLAVVAGALAGGAAAVTVAVGWAVGVVLSAEVAAWTLSRLWSRRRAAIGTDERFDRSPPTLEIARSFWAFTLPRAFAAMFRVGVLWLDVLLVGILISSEAAGIYTVATRLLQVGFLAVEAIGQAVEPMFSRLIAHGTTARVQALYQVSTGWLIALTWPLFLTLWVFAPTLLGWFGPEYVGAADVVAILALSALVGSGCGPVDILLVMAGKSMWSFRNAAVSFGLNVVLNLALIPVWGLEGAALAWAVSRVVGNVLPLLQIRRLLGIHPVGRGWIAAAAASVVGVGAVAVATRWAVGTSTDVLIAHALFAGVAYVALVWRWRTQLDLTAFTAAVGKRRTGRARVAA